MSETKTMTNVNDMLPKEQKVIAKKNKTVSDYLQDDKFKNQLALALPKALDCDRFLRTALNEFRQNPALQECSVPSVLGYFLQSAALGLEPATVLGHCYPVPFNNKKTGQKECQFILGYRGMLAISRRSGEVSTVSAHVVYEHDEFELTYGDEEVLKHKPCLTGERGAMIGVYCVVRFKDGSYQHIYMSKNKIDERRKRSKSSNYGPWVTDYNEMAKKTVFRALFKWLPLSIEQSDIASKDESVAKYSEQDDAIEVDYAVSFEEIEAAEEKE